MKIQELIQALEKTRPGIASKDIIEAMSYYFFSGTDVITYNDKISIQYPLTTEFSLFVKATDLYKFVSKVKADEISMIEKDNKLVISSKKARATLATVDDTEVRQRIDSVSKSLKSTSWLELPDNFCDNISLCQYTASKTESEGTLTCVFINGNDVVSSDNNRVSHAVNSVSMETILVKASEVKHLMAIKPVKYAVTESWLHFGSKEGCIFSMRNIKGDYPDYLQFFNFDGTEINLPKEVLEGVDLTSILADSKDPIIDFKITKGFCMLSVQSDSGQIAHRSKIEYNGEDISFTINPDFLKEMVKHSYSIVIGDGKARLKTENFSMLTLLFG